MATKYDDKQPKTYSLTEKTIRQIDEMAYTERITKSAAIEKAIEQTFGIKKSNDDGNRPMVIAVMSYKGGVGKTTTSVNLAVGLTKDGAKVLLIDMDGQGNSSAYLNSYDPESKELGIADIFYKTPVSNRLKEIDEVMVSTSYDNLWIVPSNFNFADADSRIKSEARGSYDTKLKRSLERLFQDMADTGVRPFDYVIIDCSPNLDLTTTNAIVALEAGNEASTCIVPIRIDGFAVAGLEQTINWIEDTRRDRNQNAKCWAILRTMVEKNTAAYKYGSGKIDEKYPHAAYFESEIPKSTVVTESTLVMQPLLKYKPKSKPAIAYTGFVKEIEERYAAERRD